MPSVLANVIFPTFWLPYLTLVILPPLFLWIFLSEIIVCHALGNNTPLKQLWWRVVSANLLSTLLGGVVHFALGLIPGEINNIESDHIAGYGLLVIFVSFLLSIGIEGVFLKTVRGALRLPVWRISVVANTVSYSLFLVWFLVVS